jgi:glucose-6-phosphate-specific signal transduction histidine kinase
MLNFKYAYIISAVNFRKEEFKMDENKEITWDAFVQGTVVNFFTEHKIEKMTIDDGNGNKARLAKLKDSGIKIETSSTTTI